MRSRGAPTVLLSLAFLLPTTGGAGEPPALSEIVERGPSRQIEASFAAEKRSSAMRAAALAFGARSGLARRGWEISRMLERHAPQLSSIFRFRDLLLTEGGFKVMPPVAAETSRAFRLGRDGVEAASAARVVRILSDARLVSASPDWRDYLMRRWAEAQAPVSVLFPRSQAERRRWEAWIAEGWREGVALADDVFAADVDRLSRDFQGILLWRRLRLARMATSPSVHLGDAPVSGGGKAMRIDEEFARLGEKARLVPRVSEWRPLVEKK